jgi:DNA gyrase subunit A
MPADDSSEELKAKSHEPEAASASIAPREITAEMEKSYLEYAMSVIVSRALPDARDGMKPVHRRIVFAMKDCGWRAGHAFVKSAKVVGEVIGNFHPHGDSAVYDSMVRLAQPWSLRYRLVQGQGNFGSLDGDSPAAMRYTEARLEKISDELVGDIEKETVDWQDNYDATRKEPKVLPVSFPQLLANGVTGIAVGMATNIPPHNLEELIDGCLLLLEKEKEATEEELFEIVKGPDFPAPANAPIHGRGGILEAYRTGRGKIVQRAEAEVDENQIVIKSLPYAVNKAVVVEKIAALYGEKKLEGIRDLRDESSREEAVRIVIELKKEAVAQQLLNKLFQLTDLQKAFHCNFIALTEEGKQPRLLSLRELLEEFLAHRREVVTRRTKFELAQAEARAHILEGLKIALENIDAVIETIKKSKTKEDAGKNLREKFELTEKQATAILEIRLQTLAAMETQKILEELAEKLAFIEECRALLADEKKMTERIAAELKEVREKFGDARQTKLLTSEAESFSDEDLVPNEPTLFLLSKEGYAKRLAPETFRAQGRGGRGIRGAGTKEEDAIAHLLFAETHDFLLFFTSRGRVFRKRVFEIPLASRQAKGAFISNFLSLSPEEKVTAVFRRGKEEKEGGQFFFATEKGVIKRVEAAAFANIRQNGLIAIKLRENDSLGWVRWTSGEDEIFLVTQKGQSIRFPEGEVRSMGRVASGVRGIRLKGDDRVVEMAALRPEEVESAVLLTISELGLGKASPVGDYRRQGRGGSGILTARLSPKTGALAGARVVASKEGDLLLVSEKGTVIRTPVAKIPDLGRSTQGVRVMRLESGDRVAGVTLLAEPEEE